VDEATQCCELDILVPLQYGSSKLILVGDPEQLPATVKSEVCLPDKATDVS
jgi:senataxin